MARKYGRDSSVGWADVGITPIRGRCPYDKCHYCVIPETMVLNDSLLWVSMRNLDIGSEIVGLVPPGGEKEISSYTRGIVTSKLAICAPIVEVETDRGSLACTPWHRWHSSGNRWIEARYLKEGDKITFLSLPVDPPVENEDYRRGYLRAIIAGDGTIGTYDITQKKFMRLFKIVPKRNRQLEFRWYPVKERSCTVYKFRLTMKDVVALQRASRYLDYFGIKVFEHEHMGLPSIRKDGKDSYKAICATTARFDTESFRRGFLAGMFDAEGSAGPSNSVVRIFNNDPDLISETCDSLDFFGFSYHIAPKGKSCGAITLRGGISEYVRFFALTGPAIRRKYTMQGKGIRGKATVLKLRLLDTNAEVFDIETTTGNYVADGILSHNCYMRSFFKRFRLDPTLRVSEDMHWSPRTKESLKVAVCLNLDMFHSDIPSEWIRCVINLADILTRHTFIFLTKFPGHYRDFEFPSNCWLGTTWDGLPATAENLTRLMSKEHNPDLIRFISFEPLLEEPPRIIYDGNWLKWIIIGADSRRGAKKPPIEWAEQLIEDAHEAGIAVWVKDNYGYYTEIKEYPLPKEVIPNEMR